MKDITGTRLKFGQRVEIGSVFERDRNIKYPERAWRSYDGGFPKEGIYIGYRTVRDGVVRGSYDAQPYLATTKSHVVYVVVEAENKKPFYSKHVRGIE